MRFARILRLIATSFFIMLISTHLLSAENNPLLLISEDWCCESHSSHGQHEYHATISILRLDSTEIIDTVWKLDHTPNEINNLRLQPDLGTLTIVESYGRPITVVDMATCSVVATYRVPSTVHLLQLWQNDAGRPLGQYALNCLVGKGLSQYKILRVSPSLCTELDSVGEPAAGEIRFTGTQSEVGSFFGVSVGSIFSGTPDIAWIDTGIDVTAFPVPDSIVRMRNAEGWFLFAHEKDYLAIFSIPEKGGYMEREVLIFDRHRRTWNSVLVPGDVTHLRPEGRYIVGTVSYSGPDMDWVHRVSRGEDIVSDSTVFINTDNNRIILGRIGTLLLIDGDTLISRRGNELCRFIFTDSSVAGPEIMIKDDRIRDVRWAYRPHSRHK